MLGTAGLWIVVLALAGAEPAPGAARALLAEERCQVELPIAGSATTAEARLPRPAARRAETPGARPLTVALPTSLVSAAVVVILVAAALAVLLHRLPATAELKPPATAPPSREARSTSTPEVLRAADLDAERLAREGRFAEAIHALLLRALRALAASGAAAARPALTSRELLRDARLGKDARAALEALVRAVEWAHFAGRPTGAAEYEASLAEYRRLREAWPRQR